MTHALVLPLPEFWKLGLFASVAALDHTLKMAKQRQVKKKKMKVMFPNAMSVFPSVMGLDLTNLTLRDIGSLG